MDKSASHSALKPVTFNTTATSTADAYGLVAEDVPSESDSWCAGMVKSARALRAGQRDVAQRVPQRAQKVQNLEVTVAQQQKGMEVHGAAKRAGRANPKGERPG